MDSCSFDSNKSCETLSTSQTSLSEDAFSPGGSFDGAGVAAWLRMGDNAKSVPGQDFWPAASWPVASPSLASGHRSSESVLHLQAEAETVIQLLSQFLVNEWPAEVHLIQADRLCATTFLDFVPVKLDARVTASPRGFGTELTFVNTSRSPDAVLFGKVVSACELQLRIHLGELPEGSLLKDDLLEDDLWSELEEEEPPDFQALLAELVHCPSMRMREELLQALANLAGQSSAHPGLAQAVCSTIGIFAASVYLKPQDQAPASLAETYPFAYVLRQAASHDESGDVVSLKSIMAHAMQNADSLLVARGLELALSFLPEGSTSDEGEGGDDDAMPTGSVWRATMQDEQDEGAGPVRSKAFRAFV